MMKSFLIFSTLLFGYLPLVSATSFAKPYYYITSSHSPYGNQCFFKMFAIDPDVGIGIDGDLQSFGIAYQLNEKNELVEKWRTQGWYSFRTYIGADCEHLVRMGRESWFLPSNEEALKGDVAVAFYHKGKLIKRYSVADLINDHQRGIDVNYNTYSWDISRGFSRSSSFYIKTTENNLFRFNVYTGDVVSVATQRYQYPTHIDQDLDIHILAGLYESSEIYADLHYQGVNAHNEHHWISSRFYTEDDSKFDEYDELRRDYGEDYNLVTALPVLGRNEKKDYSTLVDKNLNITMLAAEYGKFEEVSAQLNFQGIDADNQYHWTLDRYEITDLWPRRHEK